MRKRLLKKCRKIYKTISCLSEKAQAVYNELLKDINPLAERTLKGYAKKYDLNI